MSVNSSTREWFNNNFIYRLCQFLNTRSKNHTPAFLASIVTFYVFLHAIVHVGVLSRIETLKTMWMYIPTAQYTNLFSKIMNTIITFGFIMTSTQVANNIQSPNAIISSLIIDSCILELTWCWSIYKA